MAKPNFASKIKNLARDLKDGNAGGGVKKVSDAGKNPDVKKKESTLGGKASGKKD